MPELGPEPCDVGNERADRVTCECSACKDLPKPDDVSRMEFHSLSPSDWAMNARPFGPYRFGNRYNSSGGWGFNFGWFGFHKFNKGNKK